MDSPVPKVVFGGETRGSGGRLFRADIPAESVRPKWESRVGIYVLIPPDDDPDPRLRAWDGPDTEPIFNWEAPDVITLRVMDEVDLSGAPQVDKRPMWESICRAREAGQIVLYDIDDDIWHIPDWSPAKKAMHKLIPSTRAYDIPAVDANIRVCDGVIVSTPYLAKVVKERFGDSTPTYLQRPGINHEHYFERVPHDGPIRVGWMGSMSHHLEHIKTIFEALNNVTEEYEFWHIGAIRGDDSLRKLGPIKAPIRQLPWGLMPELPAKLAQVDIGIIPRWLSEFNEGQSPTSGLQWAMAGVPFLVSPSAEYIRCEGFDIGTVCWRADDWVRELSDLIADPLTRSVRARLQKAGALNNFGMTTTGIRYTKMLDGLIDGR